MKRYSSFWLKLAPRFKDIDLSRAHSPGLTLGYGWVEREGNVKYRLFKLGLRFFFPFAVKYTSKRIDQFFRGGTSYVGFISAMYMRKAKLTSRYEVSQRSLLNADVSSPSTVKAFCLSEEIAPHIPQRRDNEYKVLEIGSGFGVLAIQLIQRFRPAIYLCVDLPEMLPHALNVMFRAESVFNNYKIVSSDEVESTFLSVASIEGYLLQRQNIPSIYLVTPEQFERFGLHGFFDFAVNVDSLMEMDRENVDYYLEKLGKCIAVDGKFFSINRPKILEHEGFYNHPSDYAISGFRSETISSPYFDYLNRWVYSRESGWTIKIFSRQNTANVRRR